MLFNEINFEIKNSLEDITNRLEIILSLIWKWTGRNLTAILARFRSKLNWAFGTIHSSFSEFAFNEGISLSNGESPLATVSDPWPVGYVDVPWKQILIHICSYLKYVIKLDIRMRPILAICGSSNNGLLLSNCSFTGNY